MPIAVPTMSTRGFVKDPVGKIESLLSHFFVAEYSQTALYPGEVASLPWIIQDGAGDMQKTMDLMQQFLENYLSRYYTEAAVTVEPLVPLDTDPRIKFDMTISLNISEDGVRQSYTHQVTSTDGIFQQLVMINNG